MVTIPKMDVSKVGVEYDIRKAMSEGTTSEGGYLVPEEFSRKLYLLAQATAVAMGKMEIISMKHDVINLPTVATGTTAYVVSENTTITAAQPAYDRVTLNTKKIGALTVMSTEVMEDSDPSVANHVMYQIAKDIGLKIDDLIFNGTAGDGAWTGIRAYTAGTGINTVAATTNGDAMTIQKIIDSIQAIEADNFFGEKTLFVHAAALGRIRSVKDSNNNYLFNQFTFGSPFLKDGAVGEILGVKVVIANQLPINLTKGSGTALTDLVMVTDFKSGIVGNRREMRFNKFYDITNDSWKLQANMRMDFVLVYPASVCIIKDILTTA